MSIRAAILAAATHIERHVADYCFLSSAFPTPCETAGCALGWIGYYACIAPPPLDQPGSYMERIATAMGVSPSEFYDRMDAYSSDRSTHGRGAWTTSARSCAYALRMYAEEFHRE